MAVTAAGGGDRRRSRHPWVASLDMYRKVPGDLLEGSKEGRITSWIALCVMLWLFCNETLAFWSTAIVPQLHLDSSRIKKFSIDFNITMLDLRCDYATINVVSLLGNEQNITKNIKRWTVDGQGITKHLHNHPDDGGKQQQQRRGSQLPLVLSDPSINQTVEEIGKHSVSLDQETLDYAMEEHNFLFVKFYAVRAIVLVCVVCFFSMRLSN
jgi:Endoplasmic Reticulum-Golgi Intermediate Compartment (ERGIC)